MGDNERHVKFNLRGARRGDTFRIGFNQIGNALEKRSDPEHAVFVEIASISGIPTGDKYGALSVDEAKQIIAKLQEVVDHYDNYRPVDALGLGAIIEYAGGRNVELWINVGGSWTTTNSFGSASHATVNDWLKKGTAAIRHEGYKSGGDN
jgi:hypothetical protein